MPKRLSGISNNTAYRQIVDSGVVYVNYGEVDERMIGATQDGVGFTVNQTIRMPEIDGVKGPVMGTRRIIQSIARLTFSPMEWGPNNWKDFIVGATVTENSGLPITDTVTRDKYVLGPEVHFKNMAIVGVITGSEEPIVIKILNAIIDSEEISGAMEDDAEMTPELQATAHYGAGAEDGLEPWEVIIPDLQEAVG